MGAEATIVNHEHFDKILGADLLGCTVKLLNAPLNVEQRLDLITEEIVAHLHVDSCSIFLLDPKTEYLVLRTTRGLDPNSVGRMRLAIGEGITGYAALRMHPIAIEDMRLDPRSRFFPGTKDDRYRSILALPVLDREDLLGVINVQTEQLRRFESEEIRLLEMLSEQVVVGAIRNAQLVENLERRAVELMMLNEIGQALNSALDLDTLLLLIAEKSAEALHAKGAVIRLAIEDGDLVLGAVFGVRNGVAGGLSLDGEKRIAEFVASAGEPILIDDLRGGSMDDRFGSSLVCVPLVHEEKVVGTLSLFDKIAPIETERKLFDSDDLNVLFALSSQAAGAVEDIHLHRELYGLIRDNRKQLDEVTLLYNQTATILESISDGLIAIDEKGTVVEINPVARTILGSDGVSPGSVTIDEIVSDAPSLGERISGHGTFEGFTNRVVTLLTKRGRIDVMANLRSTVGSKGELRGAVMTFRLMGEVGKMVGGMLGAWRIYTFDDIIGESEKIRSVKELAMVAAQTTSNVLIQGETGTGKELFAQAIHHASTRDDGPFVAVNCAAIPRDLIESELFGYVEGAFTGARKGGSFGKFELASGGTIFLDEIGEMPVDVQVKLLRVLQEKAIVRVGGDRTIPVDARIIAATNRDLLEAIQEGIFREDLYYRLNVITIDIPSLRERGGDIPLFIEIFIRRFTKREGKKIDEVDQEVVNGMIRYRWPGNVRELENALEHAVAICKGIKIIWEDLPARLRRAIEGGEEERQVLTEGPLVEEKRRRIDSSRRLYLEAMRYAGGNAEEAAQALGISRATLYRRLKKYNLTGEISKLRQ